MQSYWWCLVTRLNANTGSPTSFSVVGGCSHVNRSILDPTALNRKGCVDTRFGNAKSLGCEVRADICAGGSAGLLVEKSNQHRGLASLGTHADYLSFEYYR